jgi:hypothetical protein
VNSAASSNPTLANLLQLAASGKATSEQLKTLGLLIQSLAGPSSSEESSNPSGTPSVSGTPQPDTSKASTPALGLSSQSPACISAAKAPTLQPAFVPSKEFDLVLEFAENPSDRWILPRAPVVIECIPGVGSADDILLTAGVPFANAPLLGYEKERIEAIADGNSQELVTFRFAKASSDIWSCVSRWAGAQEKMDITRKAFERLVRIQVCFFDPCLFDRLMLAWKGAGKSLSCTPTACGCTSITNSKCKLFPFALWLPADMLQSALPPYTLKSIRPTQADATKPKRVRKPAAPKHSTAKAAADAPTFAVRPPPPKKQRQAKVAPHLPMIACVACGQTNIPLIMGGRECTPPSLFFCY